MAYTLPPGRHMWRAWQCVRHRNMPRGTLIDGESAGQPRLVKEKAQDNAAGEGEGTGAGGVGAGGRQREEQVRRNGF